MKIVLDTNVFMSGIFWQGTPSKVLTLWQEEKIIVCMTPEILDEYKRVGDSLAKKYPGVNIDPFLELLTIYGEFYSDISLSQPISRDPDDDKFIACALSAKAKIIVSGDKDLLDIKCYASIDILTPKEFLKMIKK
mgnify:CR=1 FL=1